MPLPEPPRPDRPLLFLDYDGTLAPIVDDPAAAVPHPAVPELLQQLDRHHPLYVITGRHLHDLAGLLESPVQAVGLHGTQEGVLGHDVRDTIEEEALRALDRMRATVPEIEGVYVEPKGHTFAVHYRHAADEAAVRAALERWAADAPKALEAIWGKKVVELRPAGTSKGVAVRRLAAHHPDHTPIYLGDDVTDEDAFAALPDEAVTVKVGDGPTRARYRLPDVAAVVAYLQQFLPQNGSTQGCGHRA